MILNNKLTQDLLNLKEKFQNCQLDFVSSHKHLVLTFCEDLTWTVYINSGADRENFSRGGGVQP